MTLPEPLGNRVLIGANYGNVVAVRKNVAAIRSDPGPTPDEVVGMPHRDHRGHVRSTDPAAAKRQPPTQTASSTGASCGGQGCGQIVVRWASSRSTFVRGRRHQPVAGAAERTSRIAPEIVNRQYRDPDGPLAADPR